jgi:hypothetical protein
MTTPHLPDFRCMDRRFFLLTLLLALLTPARAADDATIVVDGPDYAFTISAPKGWKMTSTPEIQAAFYPAESTFEKSAVVMYVRSASKSRLHVESIAELNRLDLQGIQRRNPGATSAKIGTVKTTLGVELPMYAFTGGGYSELVAYAEQTKTITVMVVSADTPEQLQTARPAFEELVASYVFLTDTPEIPKPPAEPKKAPIPRG